MSNHTLNTCNGLESPTTIKAGKCVVKKSEKKKNYYVTKYMQRITQLITYFITLLKLCLA